MIMRKVILSSLFLIPLLGYSQTEIPDSIYNPQIQKSGETKTKGSKSGKNRGKSQFQAVIEI